MSLLESITGLLTLVAIAVLTIAIRAVHAGDLVSALFGLVAMIIVLTATTRLARWSALDRSVR